MGKSCKWLLAFAVMCAAFLAAAADIPALPKAGTIVKFRDRFVGEWRVWGGGSWCSAVEECSFVTLYQGQDFAVALSKPVERDAKGGYLSQSIQQVFLTKMDPGDEGVDCFDQPNHVQTFLNKRTKTLHYVYMKDGRLAEMRRKYKTIPDCATMGN